MPKRFNLLILAPDSDIGQSIIRIINDHFHYLNVAVPTSLYKEGTVLPPYQIAMNFANSEQIAADFSMAEVVVSCSPKYSSIELQNIAKKCGVKFVDGCISYPQAVIEAAYNRLPFDSTDMEAVQSSAGFSVFDFWSISHYETSLPTPTIVEGRWCIDQGSVSLEGVSVKHRIEFTSRILAFFFWIFSFISRFIYPFFKNTKPYRSLSSWVFNGKCYEHNQTYKFKAAAEKIDAEVLRPDLAMLKILDGLSISRNDSHDWGCCSKMKVKLVEYTIADDKQEDKSQVRSTSGPPFI